MKLGAEPKKLAILGGLLALAGIVYFINSSSDPSPAPARTAAPAAALPMPPAEAVNATPPPRREATGRGSLNEFKPAVKRVSDPSKIDPSLRLDLLAKVQSVTLEGGRRNIFQLSTPPVPQPKEPVKPIPGGIAKIDPNRPPAAPPAAIPPAGPPPAPPINLKYYGYSSNKGDGNKRAFFLDGDDIIVAAEGETVKKRYRLIKIGINSVQMEDTVLKSTQTLPLIQEAAA